MFGPPSHPSLAGAGRVLFGAAFYTEYAPAGRLETDLDLMAAAHFSVIRVGESVWSTWEPENGRFELEWLEPVLDGAHARGIAVVLGTPTYAVPPWLARLYPEIAGEPSTGVRLGWGARQEADFTHPAFRFHAERVIRAVLARYAEHPAVIGFQVDNEPGNELLHNHGVFQRFVDSLRQTYGDVETLNREWGLVYWSHRLSTWADLWTPDNNAQPQYDIAWRRFQGEQTTAYIAWQAGIVRELARADQFVTTCIAYERPAIDDEAVTRALDVTAGNPYYLMQDGLARTQEVGPQYWTTSGTWALYLSADRMFSSKQQPYLVTETNAGFIGPAWDNRPAYDGQWRQTAWALVSRGAQMIEYWHWHTLPYGAETFWGGILPHSGRPGRVYAEIARLGGELARAGELVTGLVPDADITMIYSRASEWLMQDHPPLATPAGGPDPRAYRAIFDAFYRGAFDAGLQVRVASVDQVASTGLAALVAEHPVLVAAGLYLADDDTLDLLAGYAAAGGHLVLGPRTGYADHEGRARGEVMPARLTEAAGVTYDEFSNLTVELPLVSQGELGPLPAGACGTRWLDGLQPAGADVLATFRHPHFARWPAITTHVHGSGRVTVVGTLPDHRAAAAVARWMVPATAWELPPNVTSTGARTRTGRRLRFLHNWSWDPVSVTTPVPLRDLLAYGVVSAGGTVSLGPWDVRVFEQT